MKSMPARGEAITEGVVVERGGDDSEIISRSGFFLLIL